MPGLDSLPDAPTVARIAAAAGIIAEDVRPLARATSGVAWRVDARGEAFIVRHALPGAEHSPIYEAETAILRAVRPLDARVPERIVTNRDADRDPLEGRLPWAIDRLLPGRAAHRGELSAETARDLGQLLAHLHALPVERHGALEDTREAIRGTVDDFESAAVSRYGKPWPFDGSALIAHPAARRAPDLVAQLGALRAPLMRFTAVERRALLHADLHEEHLFLLEGRLSGVVDFGDAFISVPAWDIASFGYFHGWALVEPLLEGYTARRIEREMIDAEARLLAVVIALDKMHRAEQRDEERRALALDRLGDAVARAEHIARSEFA